MDLFNRNEENVTTRLEPYLGLMNHCYKNTFSELMKYLKPVLVNFRDGTIASIIHDLVVKDIKKYFKYLNDKNIRTLDNNEYFMLVFDFKDIRIICRFNKFDENFLTSKTLTKSARKFDTQQTAEIFEDDKINVNIYAGYKIDVAYSGITCYISCPNGVRKNDWSFCSDIYYSSIKAAEFEMLIQKDIQEKSEINIYTMDGKIDKNKSKRIRVKKDQETKKNKKNK